jgi:malate dehydrogenase (oxaloacetate-decarboxylating)
VFPGLFRGVLDVCARGVTDEMAFAAAHELAACKAEAGLDENHILPAMDDIEVAVQIAVTVGLAAQRQNVTGKQTERNALLLEAREKILTARAALETLVANGLVEPEASIEKNRRRRDWSR